MIKGKIGYLSDIERSGKRKLKGVSGGNINMH
jgi:hypothetical protein